MYVDVVRKWVFGDFLHFGIVPKKGIKQGYQARFIRFWVKCRCQSTEIAANK